MSLPEPSLVIILGAGASKPLGIPTSKDLVEEFLKTKSAAALLSFKELILNEEWDIEKLLRLIQHVKNLARKPQLSTLLGITNQAETLEGKIIELNKEYESIYEDLLRFIRKKCLDVDLEKAIRLYEPLLELREISTIKIFTTNYDTAIEDVCKHLQVETYNDGFVIKSFDEYRKFYPETLGAGNPQLYKLHGSVNWWTDETRQDIFRLSLDLEGISSLRTMMIYPAEIESTFNYPFNVLQSQYVLALIDADFVIAIGHRFGDINISLPIKGLLEKPNFNVTIIDPEAEGTKKATFNDHSNVKVIPLKFEDWVQKGIDEVRERIQQERDGKEETGEPGGRRLLGFKPVPVYEQDKSDRQTIIGYKPGEPVPVYDRGEVAPSEFRVTRYKSVPVGRCPKCTKLITPDEQNRCPNCGYQFAHATS